MPFIVTALFGDEKDDNILHIGAVRLRINGTGFARMTLLSLDDSSSEVLRPLPITTTPGRDLTRLSNFKSEKTKLRIETTAIDEQVKVNKIVLFAKEIWKSYPGNY